MAINIQTGVTVAAFTALSAAVATNTADIAGVQARAASVFTWYTVGSPATTSVRYASPRAGNPAATPYVNSIYVVPAACTAAGIAFANNTANILATDTLAFTLSKASSGTTTFTDTSCTATIPANTAQGTTVAAACNAALAAGDQLALKLVQSGTENQTSWVGSFTVSCK